MLTGSLGTFYVPHTVSENSSGQVSLGQPLAALCGPRGGPPTHGKWEFTLDRAVRQPLPLIRSADGQELGRPPEGRAAVRGGTGPWAPALQ